MLRRFYRQDFAAGAEGQSRFDSAPVSALLSQADQNRKADPLGQRGQSGNQLSSLTLSSANGLLRSLNLRGNRFIDASFLQGLSSVSIVNLQENMLTHLSVPPGLTNLTELHLFHNQIAEINLPGDLINLAWLDLVDNRLSDSHFIKDLPALRQLDMDDNDL